MYHTMFPPPMLVQVSQQGHFEGHRQGRMQPAGNLPINPFEQNGFVRRNEGSPRYSLERRPVKSYSLEDVSRPFSEAMRYGPKSQPILSVFPAQNYGSKELLQLIGIEMPTVRLNYGHHPASVRNGNNNVNSGLTPWRDRCGGGGGTGGGGTGSNQGPGLRPPPVPVRLRPITNCANMKRVFWGNKESNNDPRRTAPFNHRNHDRRRYHDRSPPSRGGDGASSEAYSSDSGFSSRSPTPSSQQVSPTSTRGSGDNDAHIGAGEPALHRVTNIDDGKMKRPHEVNSGPPNNNHRHHHQQYYQPFFPNNNHNHRNQGGPPHDGIPLHPHHPHPNEKRSESMTSLTSLTAQGAVNGGYQSKKRFYSQSPPAQLSSKNGSQSAPRGRRLNGYSIRSSQPSPNLPQCFIAPERFLARSHLICVTSRPAQLTVGDGWDEPYFPRYGLFLVGSTISGFGSNTSDMDMCLLVRHSEMDQRSEAVSYLEQVLKCLRHSDFVRDPELIQAKVPILKFSDTRNNLEVDLNCNNAVGIRNTHLLYCYSQLDWRVRPLVLVVKTWAATNGINDAKNMTISSYSLVLMVISYLQCGVNPSVLPNLHALYPGKFSPESDLHTIDLHEELNPYKSNNTQSLGQLLLGFLEYYANFDYNQDAISVRQAKRVPIEECRHARSYKNDPHQWKYLCIEEPFDLTNTAHSVYDPEVFEKVKQVFHTSYAALKESRDLASIFRRNDEVD